MTQKMSYWTFRALLDLFMASDPCPIDRMMGHFIRKELDRQADFWGYEDWVEAYHEH